MKYKGLTDNHGNTEFSINEHGNTQIVKKKKKGKDTFANQKMQT